MKSGKWTTSIVCMLVFVAVTFIFMVIFLRIQKYGEENPVNHATLVYIRRAEDISGMDLDPGKIRQFTDTKDGYLGKGHVILELEYEGEDYESLKESLGKREYWEKLPLNESLEKCLDGLDVELPTEGYFIVYDRHISAKDRFCYDEIPDRNSLSFSVVMFDPGQKKVFYLEQDK